jgi:hypothetical protein
MTAVMDDTWRTRYQKIDKTENRPQLVVVVVS